MLAMAYYSFWGKVIAHAAKIHVGINGICCHANIFGCVSLSHQIRRCLWLNVLTNFPNGNMYSICIMYITIKVVLVLGMHWIWGHVYCPKSVGVKLKNLISFGRRYKTFFKEKERKKWRGMCGWEVGGGRWGILHAPSLTTNASPNKTISKYATGVNEWWIQLFQFQSRIAMIRMTVSVWAEHSVISTLHLNSSSSYLIHCPKPITPLPLPNCP